MQANKILQYKLSGMGGHHLSNTYGQNWELKPEPQRLEASLLPTKPTMPPLKLFSLYKLSIVEISIFKALL